MYGSISKTNVLYIDYSSLQKQSSIAQRYPLNIPSIPEMTEKSISIIESMITEELGASNHLRDSAIIYLSVTRVRVSRTLAGLGTHSLHDASPFGELLE